MTTSPPSSDGAPPGPADRDRPNILVTGTPGTGKTTTASLIADALGFKHVDVGALVKEQGLHDGMDDEHDALLLDEDKVVDALDPILAPGGVVVDYHGSDFFPARFFDRILVLTADTAVLWDRLEARGYGESKVRENVQCEIMRVCADEALSAWPADAVVVAASNTVEDMDACVDATVEWARGWR